MVDRSEIAFFDLETTFPTRPDEGSAILEFGSILVCPRKLIELESYETLVRPHDLSLIAKLSVRANGITPDAVVSAPTFADVADKVFDILHGRTWAGHNIIKFDWVMLKEAFAQINRPPPEPKGMIDTLPLLTHTFGERAGNMKMATLADYFGLGKQSHRSLDDVRMNLEVLKYCATALFLECFRNIFTGNSSLSPNATTRNLSNAKADVDEPSPSTSAGEQAHDQLEPGRALCPPVDKIETEPRQSNDVMEEEPSINTQFNTISESNEFLELDEVFIPSVALTVVTFSLGPPKMQILHKDAPLQIHCDALKVRFGLRPKYFDHAGRPRLSFVVDASPNLCCLLDACDNIAKMYVDSDSHSEWRPVVTFYNSPTIRLQLPTVAEGYGVRCITEIYQKESPPSASIQRVVFGRYDVAKLEQLIRPGSFVDAYISVDPYDYQQNAGIRLVAEKLVVDSN